MNLVLRNKDRLKVTAVVMVFSSLDISLLWVSKRFFSYYFNQTCLPVESKRWRNMRWMGLCTDNNEYNKDDEKLKVVPNGMKGSKMKKK